MESTQRNILLLDDEEPILELYVRCLAEPGESPVSEGEDRVRVGGLRLLRASSGERAVELVEQELEAGRRTCGGFFDLKLPDGMDGVEAMRRLRALDPDLLCTVVSGHGSRSVEDIQALFVPDHADEWDFIAKPFTPWEVRQKCRQMVASWHRRRSEEAHRAENLRLLRRLEEQGACLEERLRRRSEELERERSRPRRVRGGKGRRTPNWKVTEATREAVGALLTAGYSKTTIGQALRLHRSTVWTIERELQDDQTERPQLVGDSP